MARRPAGRERLRVVHLTTALSPSGAGVFEAVRGITRHLAAEGTVDVQVVGVASDGHDAATLARDWPNLEVTCLGPGGIRGSRALLRYATTCDPRGIEVVHAHGIWDGASVAGRILAQRAGCPFILAPHGMLADWAFRHRRYKKLLPWMLWVRQTLAQADVLEAKSETEAKSFAARALMNRVEVIPVGLDVPPARQPAVRHDARRTCLFLSRIHPVKGIDALLHGWATVRPEGWRLVIAGPDADGYEAAMKQLASQLQIGDSVSFVGPRHGAEKAAVLAEAELFVLPSHTENFGIVVAEALAAGVPCIATTGTPWTQLPARGLGWCVDANAGSLATALHTATRLPPEALRAMGQRGPQFVADAFSWSAVTRRTIELYASLRGATTGPAP